MINITIDRDGRVPIPGVGIGPIRLYFTDSLIVLIKINLLINMNCVH